MNKKMFMAHLEYALKQARVADQDTYLQNYSELIDDHIDEGMSENEAVITVGSIPEIISQLQEDQPIQVISKRKINPWIVILLILGFPIWFLVILTVIILILVAYILLWLIPIISATVSISFITGGLYGIVAAVFAWINAGWIMGITELGISFALIGAGWLLGGVAWELFKIFGKITVRFSKWLILKIKYRNGVIA